MRFRDWLSTITNDNQGEIAEKANMSRRTLQNQIYKKPQISTVIKICKAYDINPVTSLVELGVLDPKWATPSKFSREEALAAATAAELSAEVARRLLAAEAAEENSPDKPPTH